MVSRRLTRSAAVVLALAIMLLAGLQAAGLPAQPRATPAGNPAAAPVADAAADTTAKPAHRFRVNRLRHSLRMPFFSFQPLG